MCAGVPILANNKKAVYGKGTNSHSTTCEQLKIDGDKYRKFEWLWWEKKLQQVHYDQVAEEILEKIDLETATGHAKKLVKTNFNTQDKLAKWLKDTPDEWDKLLDPKFKTLAKKVNPKLLTYQDKIEKFKKEPIEKYNPYQATKLPKIEQLKKFPELDQVGDQVWAQVRAQVWDQVWDQVGVQVGAQVGVQVGAQVGAQVGVQVGDQVWDQVWDQVRATSYWAVKITFGLPIDHWFFNFLKLGVMIVFVKGKVKVFGKKGKYLGEYDESDLR